MIFNSTIVFLYASTLWLLGALIVGVLPMAVIRLTSGRDQGGRRHNRPPSGPAAALGHWARQRLGA